MDLTNKLIEELIQKTISGELPWEKRFDQDCCSSLNSYRGSGYIICLFNKGRSNEFIIFDELNEFGSYEIFAERYDQGHPLYKALHELTVAVDSKVMVVS
jgi:hypothetical protein